MMINKIKTGKKLKFLLPLIFSVLFTGTTLAQEERQADPIKEDLLEAGEEGLFQALCLVSWC